jgi:hypothetical protein
MLGMTRMLFKKGEEDGRAMWKVRALAGVTIAAVFTSVPEIAAQQGTETACREVCAKATSSIVLNDDQKRLLQQCVADMTCSVLPKAHGVVPLPPLPGPIVPLPRPPLPEPPM